VPGDAAAGSFDQPTLSLELGKDATHPGSGNRQLLLAQQDGQLVFAPARVAQAQGQNPIGQRGRPGGLTPPMRTVGTLFQGREVLGIIPALPAVERLAADSKMATGASHVAAATIKIHPGQTSPGLPAQLFPRARQLARTRKFPIANLHFDTLSECH